MGAVISVSLFVATSELLLWEKLFSMDKNTAISFARLKHDVEDTHKKLDAIEALIRDT